MLLGGEGDDVIAKEYEPDGLIFQRIDGGRGVDTLVIYTGGPISIAVDLTQIPDNKLTGIERIELPQMGPTRLTLNALEV